MQTEIKSRHAWRSLLAWMAVGALLLPFFLPWPPAALTSSLDSSWMGAIDILNRNGPAMGNGVFFTYGPLGHWYLTAFYGQPLWPWAVFNLVKAGLTVGVLLYVARGRGLPFSLLVITGGLLARMFAEDGVLLFLTCALSYFITVAPKAWMRFLASFLLAVCALVKFTFTASVVSGLGVATIALVADSRTRNALTTLGVFLGTFISLWLLAGNHPGDLPRWLASSAQLTSGYASAMSHDESTAILRYALLGATTIAGSSLALLALADRRTAWPAIALSGLATFLAWKHGIIRAPGHTMIFFGITPLLTAAVLSTWPRESARKWRAAPPLILLGALAIALLGLGSISPNLVGQLGWRARQHLANGVAWLTGLREQRTTLVMELSEQRKDNRLPQTAALTGRKTVDVFGHEQGVALLNALPYAPRPIPQSYSAYTPSLIRANADFYRSDRRPDLVLFKLQAVDGHIASLTDGQALLEILRRYRPAIVEREFILLAAASRPGPEPEAEADPIAALPATFGQWIELPATPADKWQQVRIHFSPSWFGALRSWLYKPAIFFVELRFDDEHVEIRRLNLTAAPAGFLAAPWLDDTEQVIQLWSTPSQVRKVRALRILEPKEQMPSGIKPAGRVEIRTLHPPLAPLSADELAGFTRSLANRFESILGLQPEGMRLAHQRTYNEQGHPVMLVTPGDWLVFRAPDEAQGLSGEWGMLEGAYTAPNATDGMAASLAVASDPQGPWTEIWQGWLHPFDQPKHRGVLAFSARLPASKNRWIRLEFGPGPKADGAFDWGFLARLRWNQAP